jgi:hypothetical protein
VYDERDGEIMFRSDYSFKEQRITEAMSYDGESVYESYSVSIDVSNISKMQVLELRALVERICND